MEIEIEISLKIEKSPENHQETFQLFH